MGSIMQRQIPVFRHRLLCCGVVLLGAGCAARSGSASSPPLPAPFADLAAREIRRGEFVTAYDAVYGLRHEFLTMADHRARGALVLEPAVVYVDGARAGGLDALKSIPASEVRRIRFVKPIDTTGALGTRLTGGAILVETAH